MRWTLEILHVSAKWIEFTRWLRFHSNLRMVFRRYYCYLLSGCRITNHRMGGWEEDWCKDVQSVLEVDYVVSFLHDDHAWFDFQLLHSLQGVPQTVFLFLNSIVTSSINNHVHFQEEYISFSAKLVANEPAFILYASYFQTLLKILWDTLNHLISMKGEKWKNAISGITNYFCAILQTSPT